MCLYICVYVQVCLGQLWHMRSTSPKYLIILIKKRVILSDKQCILNIYRWDQ